MDWFTSLPFSAALVILGTCLIRKCFARRLGNGFYHLLKWLISCIYISLHNLSIKENSKDFPLLGLLPSPAAVASDKPQKLSSLFVSKAVDLLRFSGRDSNGQWVLLQMTRFQEEEPEVWITLGLGNHGSFKLPLDQDTFISNRKVHTFRAKGLNFEVLEAMSRWRISFTGLLRKEHCGVEQEATEVVSVQFTFIWTAFTEPFECKSQLPLWADALAYNFGKKDEINNIQRFTENRYEQWGQLQGTVVVEEQEELQLHLWGQRLHSFGNNIWEDVTQHIEVEAYITDGTLFHIGAVAFSNGPSRFQYGHLNDASGVVWAVSWTDLCPEVICANSVTIQLDAGGQTHSLELNLQLSHPTLQIANDELCYQSNVYQVSFKYNGKKGFGWAILSRRNENQMAAAANKQRQSFQFPAHIGKQLALVLSYENSACCQPGLVGGKGASLAKIHFLQGQLEDRSSPCPAFSMPKALCITTQAYFQHVQKDWPEVSVAINQLEDVAWKKRDGILKEECEKVVDVIYSTQLSEDIRSDVSLQFSKMFACHAGPFAVRSSAIGEDSDDTSAAGQQQTYLGVKDLQQIFQCIVKCWASQFTYAAVEYKRQRGQLLNPGMGVVIQVMVNPQVAGVMFTADPLTASTAIITITANYGLAESVVSASAEPDTVLLKRTHRGNVIVHANLVGTKKVQTVLNEDGGTTELQVDVRMASRNCLSDQLALQLAKIGLALEQAFGGPQDVEWAVANEGIYLLQARPITTFGKASDFEVTHELDSPMRTDHERSTKANTGEVFPNASTPLTLSTVVRCLDIAIQWNLLQRHSSARYCPFNFGKQLVVTHNHVLMNCIDLMCRDSPGHRTLTSRVLELSVYGHELDDTSMYEVAGRRYAQSSTKLSFFFQLVLDLWKNKARVKRMLQEYQDFSVDTTSLLSLDLYNNINEILPRVVQCCHSHSLVTTASAFWNLVAIITLTENNSEWSESLYADIATLLSSCSDVESADVPSAMQELVDIILMESDHNEFAQVDTTENALRWLRSHGPKLKATFEKFIGKHGHRCLKEQMVKNPNKSGPKKTYTSIEETLNKLMTPKSWRTKWILRWILPRYREAVGYREQSKSVLIRVVDQLRLAYNTLAASMVKEGRLPDDQLIFFLTHAEIGQLIDTRSPRLVSKAIQRKRLQPSLDELSFSEVVIGIPQPQKLVVENERSEGSTKITGTPVCNGVAKGTARVVKKLENATEIRAGDILITYSTDIGWSPYFPLLAGVVTEIGGILSHGAVVAREYGLPCIVGARGATSLYTSDEIVILNGSKGTLERCGKIANQQSANH